LDYFAKMQPDQGVGIVNHLDFPGLRSADQDAEFFVQFPLERLFNCLARLQFAARKLPVAGVGFAKWA
jgi:hypothetical protein